MHLQHTTPQPFNALVYIYSHTDPRTNVIEYVGQARNPEARLRAHLRTARDCGWATSPHYEWLRELQSLGLVPVLGVLAISDQEHADEIEIRCIKEQSR